MTPSSQIPQEPKSTPAGRSRSKLFAALALSLAFNAAFAVGGAIWLVISYGPRRQASIARQVYDTRVASATMGSVLTSLVKNGFSRAWIDARRAHLRACYLEPDKIDLDKISWNLLTRPAPFVGYLPEPGKQPGGSFNHEQLRGARELTLPKLAGVYRIFLSGGSLAYSIGSPSDDATIAVYLEQELNRLKPFPGLRIEVFNAAVCGWASTQERINIEDRICNWEPDLVVALSGANDVHWGFMGNDTLNFRSYEDQMYLQLMNLALAGARAPQIAGSPPQVSSKPLPPRQVGANFDWNMRRSADALHAIGARLLVVLQPTLSAAHKPLSAGEKIWLDQKEDKDAPGKLAYLAQSFAAMHSAIDDTANQRSLFTADLQDAFKDRSDPIFTDLYHVGDKGSQIIAKQLAQKIAALPPPGK